MPDKSPQRPTVVIDSSLWPRPPHTRRSERAPAAFPIALSSA